MMPENHTSLSTPGLTKLLLVDDSSTNNLLFRSIFEEKGYQVLVLEDPLLVMDCLHEFKPDLILLDLMLPGISGLQLLYQIKSDSYSHNIPIVIYTAHYSGRIKQQALALGAAAYLLKPISREQILHEISEILTCSSHTAGLHVCHTL